MPLPSSLARFPVSFALIGFSTLVFLLFYVLHLWFVLEWFNFVPLTVYQGRTVLGEAGDWWRYITPAFLHFGWMHLVFNCLWLWEFGQRIEARVGPLNMLGLFITSSAFSNTVQYLWDGPGIFGGMSGVVYAWLGFLWAGSLVRPGWLSQPPQGIRVFMLIWLVIGMLGTLEFLGVGAIANGAHVGGLIIGFLLGGVFGLLSRFGQK